MPGIRIVAAASLAVAIATPAVLAANPRLAGSPPAPAIAPDFKIVGSESLPGRCAPPLVAQRMAVVIGAFNAGGALRFARYFSTKARFEPYNGHPGVSYKTIGRAAIASVVVKRHLTGDGWTAFELDAPSEAIGEGIFGLFLRVGADGLHYERGVKVIVSCGTGLVRSWRGPSWTT